MPIRLDIEGEHDLDERDSTTFRVTAQTLREMIDIGDHQGITASSAIALCRLFDTAATNVSGVEPELRRSLLRVASTIQDRQTWAPRGRAREESSPVHQHPNSGR